LSQTANITRDDLLDRLGAASGDEAQGDVIGRLLLERFSCRAFRPDCVPAATLEMIFAAAQFTANWCNAQAWQIVVTEREATERFRHALFAKASEPGAGSAPDIPFPLRYDGVFGERRKEAGVALYRSVGIAREDRDGAARQMLENYRFFGAPHVLILTTEADLGTYGAVDCGIYLGNLMLLMQGHGIASIAQGALPRFSPFIREFFGIPDNRQVLCGLSFGYADDDHPANRFRTTRSPAEAAVRWVSS
jgi:nitroreductase